MAHNDGPRGILNDPARRSIVDERANEFRKELDEWKLDRGTDHEKPLPKGIKDTLVEGLYSTVENLDRAETSPRYRDIIRVGGALVTESDLLDNPDIKARPDRKDVTRKLLGSMIRRSLDTAKEAGINHPLVHVEPEHFFTHDPSKPPQRRR